MVQELTSKISLTSWALGGNLIKVSKTDNYALRPRSTKQVVVTELDSVCLLPLTLTPNYFRWFVYLAQKD